MEAGSVDLPLIVIVGPTASGKTALAIDLAWRYGGEIICADSRTVYKNMDIGTAKPTSDEQARVPHWGVDLLEPGERFTAAHFKRYATAKIAEIRSRGNIPFLVGGTGLYVDGVVFDYEFGSAGDASLRTALNRFSIEALHEYCSEHNVTLPNNKYNKRYVIRAIEQKSISVKRRSKPIDSTVIVGITTDRTELRERIKQRAEQLFENGVVEEAILLGEKYGWDNESMTGNVYPLVRDYHNGAKTLSEIKEQFITLDWRLAKRQLTWFRRNKYIQWYDLNHAEHYISELLAPSKNS